MNVAAFFIADIYQVDNHTFAVAWNDGVRSDFRLCTLQQHCPCAGCQHEASETRLKSVDEDVRAKRIVSVGRYALRIEFTSGCSAGIYGYDLLRALSVQTSLTPSTSHA